MSNIYLFQFLYLLEGFKAICREPVSSRLELDEKKQLTQKWSYIEYILH